MAKHEYSTTFQLISGWDEDTIIELEVDVQFDYIPGAPATGPSLKDPGDPGYGPEVDFGPSDLTIYQLNNSAPKGERPIVTRTKVKLPSFLITAICDHISDTQTEAMVERAEED